MKIRLNDENQLDVSIPDYQAVVCKFCKLAFKDVEKMWYCKLKDYFYCDHCDTKANQDHAGTRLPDITSWSGFKVVDEHKRDVTGTTKACVHYFVASVSDLGEVKSEVKAEDKPPKVDSE